MCAQAEAVSVYRWCELYKTIDFDSLRVYLKMFQLSCSASRLSKKEGKKGLYFQLVRPGVGAESSYQMMV